MSERHVTEVYKKIQLQHVTVGHKPITMFVAKATGFLYQVQIAGQINFDLFHRTLVYNNSTIFFSLKNVNLTG